MLAPEQEATQHKPFTLSEPAGKVEYSVGNAIPCFQWVLIALADAASVHIYLRGQMVQVWLRGGPQRIAELPQESHNGRISLLKALEECGFAKDIGIEHRQCNWPQRYTFQLLNNPIPVPLNWLHTMPIRLGPQPWNHASLPNFHLL